MKLMNELLDIEEAKKPKCTCDKDEATCKVHGKKLNESEEYEDSAEFTDDWSSANSYIEKATTIYEDPRFRAWMDVTDDNYGTDCMSAYSEIVAALKSLNHALSELDAQLEEADNG